MAVSRGVSWGREGGGDWEGRGAWRGSLNGMMDWGLTSRVCGVGVD